MKRIICVFTLLSACIFGIHAQQKVTRMADVVYDHRDGLAFVLDVIKPEKQNGAGILYILSGGWVSRPASALSTESFKQFTDKGYTVFVISHCSQPRYNVSEIIGEVQRAIRFIRFNAGTFGIDPDRLGIEGHSAGAHLSISAAVFGKEAVPEQEYRRIHSIPADQKLDPVELVSSRVRAVACFYPPTNFVNYIDKNTNWFDFRMVRNVSVNGSFIATPDSSRTFQNEVLKSISPYFFISKIPRPFVLFTERRILWCPSVNQYPLLQN